MTTTVLKFNFLQLHTTTTTTTTTTSV